jgi:hypothetical protein
MTVGAKAVRGAIVDLLQPNDYSAMTISTSVRCTRSEDGAVLLDAAQGVCFGLNATGLAIWDMLVNRTAVPGIVQTLQSRTGLSLDVVETDVHQFIGDLQANRLVKTEPTN